MRNPLNLHYRWLVNQTEIEPVRAEWLSEGYEHSTDGGKTWKPCGVEEVE
jgi:hypothetical protein